MCHCEILTSFKKLPLISTWQHLDYPKNRSELINSVIYNWKDIFELQKHSLLIFYSHQNNIFFNKTIHLV